MIHFKCRLYVGVIGSDRMLYRDAVLPIPPFVGLVVGSQKVVEVLVSQFGDSEKIECKLDLIDEAAAEYWLLHNGWSEL